MNVLKTSLAGSAAAIVVPTIVPSTVFGKTAPSNKINIGQIGCGRIALSHDMPSTLRWDEAHMIAVCDLDSKRKQGARDWVAKYYKDHKKKGYIDVKMYDDYREMLTNKEIDAVIVRQPDTWHAQHSLEAALAGKPDSPQQPNSQNLEES